VQTDPVGYKAGMNWYVYCGNGPVRLTDPSGTDPNKVCLEEGYTPYYQLDRPASCLAASIQNILYVLGSQVAPGAWTIPGETDVRKELERVYNQQSRDTWPPLPDPTGNASYWNTHPPLAMDSAVVCEVINDYLKLLDSDPCKVKVYKVLNWRSDPSDLLDAVKKGPVLTGVNYPDGITTHAIVITSIDNGRVEYADPADGQSYYMSLDEYWSLYDHRDMVVPAW